MHAKSGDIQTQSSSPVRNHLPHTASISFNFPSTECSHSKYLFQLAQHRVLTQQVSLSAFLAQSAHTASIPCSSILSSVSPPHISFLLYSFLFFLGLLQLTSNYPQEFSLHYIFDSPGWVQRHTGIPTPGVTSLRVTLRVPHSRMHSFLIQHGCPYNSDFFITSIMFQLHFSSKDRLAYSKFTNHIQE